MMYKKLLFFILIFFMAKPVFAKDLPIQVVPESKITTSSFNLKEGDDISFVVAKDIYIDSKLYFKKGEKVTGLITSLVDNGFNCQEASIYIENFHLKNIHNENINLSGIVYRKGHDHSMLIQFIPILYPFVRGGEVQILPEKDVFTLYMDERL